MVIEELEEKDIEALVWAVALSGDGQTCITAGFDKTLRVWRVKDGTVRKTIRLSAKPRSVAFSRDDKEFAAGQLDGRIILWRLSTLRAYRAIRAHNFIVESVDFAPDGWTLVSGSFDGTFKLWHLRAGRLIRSFGGK